MTRKAVGPRQDPTAENAETATQQATSADIVAPGLALVQPPPSAEGETSDDPSSRKDEPTKGVGLIIANWRDLPDAQWRMAVVLRSATLDYPGVNERTGEPIERWHYFRGSAFLCLGMGYSWPAGTTADDKLRRQRSRQSARKIIKKLADAGLLSVVDHEKWEFKLHLDKPRKLVGKPEPKRHKRIQS